MKTNRPYTTEVDSLTFDNIPATFDLSWIPQIPDICYYNDNDVLLCRSNDENIFYGIRSLITKNDWKGYYCTVETEWYDENDEYQGNGKEKSFKKFYFNVNERHEMGSFPGNIFNVPFDLIMVEKFSK